jgi:hypothetical protein
MKLFIASPTKGSMGVYTGLTFANAMYHLGKAGIEAEHPRMYDEYPLSEARNKAVEEFLESDCTHILFWDSDQVFRSDSFVQMFRAVEEHKFKVLSGWYMASNGTGTLVLFKRISTHALADPYNFSEYRPLKAKEYLAVEKNVTPHGTFREIDGIGFGFVMIEKSVFREIPYPWFAEWSPFMAKRVETYRFGEDLWFCDLCRKNGIPITVMYEGFVGHWAKQGYVVDEKHFEHKLRNEGVTLK